MGKTNYQTASQRLVLLCIFPEPQQRGHLSAHASEGQYVESPNCEILAKLKIELSVNITKYQLI